jgi:hypothetical protein
MPRTERWDFRKDDEAHPIGVKKPSEADKVIRAKSSIGDVSDYRCEREFPRSKSAVEIGCACTRNHDRIELSSVWLADDRTSADVNKRDEHWPN